ncbi:glycosyltransferase family 2 protein [Mediterraneibacter glycyrrhizinilyticus]|nr:glycosyltransferase family 2 protein [Mediterraneibacter glycyrrhizinilyticus]
MNTIKADPAIPIPVAVIQQANSGVSTARNTGIRKSETPLVLVLDGDDKVKPSYIEQVCKLLHENTSMVAASSNVKSMSKRLELMRFIKKRKF